MRARGSAISAPAALKGAPRVWVSLALLAAAVFATVPVYGGLPSQGLTIAHRFGLTLLWSVLAFASARVGRLKPLRPAFMGLFGVSLGFALAYMIGGRPAGLLGLSTSTPQGAAADKLLSEALPVCAAIFLATALARRGLDSLGLLHGRVWLSVALGLLATAPVLALFVVDPSGSSRAVLAVPAATLRSWMPWLVLFSIANGSMEELWFRGAWFGSFEEVLGSSAAMHVTSAAFCVVHVIVYWREPTAIAMLTPVWLYMGYAYAGIVRKTGSLAGPVLSHAIADVMFLLVTFSGGKAL